jgi:hypothetical protein
MILKETILRLINEQNYKGNTKTQPLINAIKNRNPVTFFYSGPIKPKKDSVKRGSRINAEIVSLGLTKKGYMAVRAYVQPPSTSKKGFQKHGWRTFLVTRMSDINVNNESTFDTKRPGYKEGDDKSFTVTYVKTNWGVEVKPKQIEKPKSMEPTPQPKPEEKPIEKPQPKPTEKPTPEPEPQKVEPVKQELPEPKPEEKPTEEPEDENLQESIKRIKRLMLF